MDINTNIPQNLVNFIFHKTVKWSCTVLNYYLNEAGLCKLFFFAKSVALHINMLRKRGDIFMSTSNLSSTERAFSLIELMIVVSLIGIIATIAVPSYINYMGRSNRTAAVAYLFNLSNKEEQMMLDTRQYSATYSSLLAVPSQVSSNYTISVAVSNAAAPPTYTLTATPTSAQLARDAKCGTLTINQAGTTTKSGTGTLQDCWSGK
ncbi:MAG: prepilin-type N-terminal cleavage/methylation domain-containing protein [Proteobacteria bacterium]|nr:prepilin-type N-terminal cleavage/methylation domain-containing protein [Pseudomonadota bacterium]